jgi:hypothetical protein
MAGGAPALQSNEAARTVVARAEEDLSQGSQGAQRERGQMSGVRGQWTED